MARFITLQSDHGLAYRLAHLNWGLLFLIFMIACIGFASLYSAGGGGFDPWASKQLARFGVGLAALFVVALIDVRWWYRLAWPAYFIGLGLLIYVEVFGHVGMGAQRWIDLKVIHLQPSEVMKIAVVMALARYFHRASKDDMHRIWFLIPAVAIILTPVALVLLQPDLGTSLMIVMVGVGMIFIAGAPIWMFITGGVLAVASVPVIWNFLHGYQKSRVLIFLDPDSDPLGAGYHITQSKIALGSGGFEGKGFLNGSQSHLNFLPEKQTDFIFTLWAEETGFLGGATLLGLYGVVFLYGLWIASKARQNFTRYLAFGMILNFSLYVFINISMVMGLIPVVGAPLPLISYGGTVMLTTMISFGLIMSCSIHRDSKVTRI